MAQARLIIALLLVPSLTMSNMHELAVVFTSQAIPPAAQFVVKPETGAEQRREINSDLEGFKTGSIASWVDLRDILLIEDRESMLPLSQWMAEFVSASDALIRGWPQRFLGQGILFVEALRKIAGELCSGINPQDQAPLSTAQQRALLTTIRLFVEILSAMLCGTPPLEAKVLRNSLDQIGRVLSLQLMTSSGPVRASVRFRFQKHAPLLTLSTYRLDEENKNVGLAQIRLGLDQHGTQGVHFDEVLLGATILDRRLSVIHGGLISAWGKSRLPHTSHAFGGWIRSLEKNIRSWQPNTLSALEFRSPRLDMAMIFRSHSFKTLFNRDITLETTDVWWTSLILAAKGPLNGEDNISFMIRELVSNALNGIVALPGQVPQVHLTIQWHRPFIRAFITQPSSTYQSWESLYGNYKGYIEEGKNYLEDVVRRCQVGQAHGGAGFLWFLRLVEKMPVLLRYERRSHTPHPLTTELFAWHSNKIPRAA